jgi:hypothetical protein
MRHAALRATLRLLHDSHQAEPSPPILRACAAAFLISSCNCSLSDFIWLKGQLDGFVLAASIALLRICSSLAPVLTRHGVSVDRNKGASLNLSI